MMIVTVELPNDAPSICIEAMRSALENVKLLTLPCTTVINSQPNEGIWFWKKTVVSLAGIPTLSTARPIQ